MSSRAIAIVVGLTAKVAAKKNKKKKEKNRYIERGLGNESERQETMKWFERVGCHIGPQAHEQSIRSRLRAFVGQVLEESTRTCL